MRVKISNGDIVGHKTRVVNAETDELIEDIYKVVWTADVNEICRAELYMHTHSLDVVEGMVDCVWVGDEKYIRYAMVDPELREQFERDYICCRSDNERKWIDGDEYIKVVGELKGDGSSGA